MITVCTLVAFGIAARGTAAEIAPFPIAMARPFPPSLKEIYYWIGLFKKFQTYANWLISILTLFEVGPETARTLKIAETWLLFNPVFSEAVSVSVIFCTAILYASEFGLRKSSLHGQSLTVVLIAKRLVLHCWVVTTGQAVGGTGAAHVVWAENLVFSKNFKQSIQSKFFKTEQKCSQVPKTIAKTMPTIPITNPTIPTANETIWTLPRSRNIVFCS